MPFFKESGEVVECIGSLLEWAGGQKELAEKFKALGLVIRLNYTNPPAVLTIDCKNPPRREGDIISWFEGDGGVPADVEFSMLADVGHRFWLGKVNLIVALMKRDVIAKGPTIPIIKMLPLLKPLYAQYPKILEEKGRAQLVNA